VSRSAGRKIDASTELTVVCLVNAGRWEDVEPQVAPYSECSWSPVIALGMGIARLRLGRWEQALEGLVNASEQYPDHLPLRNLTVGALITRASAHMRAREWDTATVTIGDALRLEPCHPVALRMQSSLRAATPLAQLLAGERAETAVAWERELVQNRKTETAHHLAILYYWWAVREGPTDLARAASLWQRSIAFWVYTINDQDYWKAWRARKKSSYELDPAEPADLEGAVRKDLVSRISALSGALEGEPLRYVEDLAMDCWAEFEIATLLRGAGAASAYGPLLMDMLGLPDLARDVADPEHQRAIRLGECDLPFIPDIDGLFAVCRSGLIRALAYLANRRYDRAEMLVHKKVRADEERSGASPIAGEMLAYIRIQQAEHAYLRLKCPPENAQHESVQEYASAVRELITSLADVHVYVVRQATVQALVRLVGLFGRRTYNEFISFEGGSTDQTRFLEEGIEVLDRCLRLTDGIQDVEEARLHLAAMVNRLALQLDREAHDHVIDLLERAVRLAPDNPNYRRNLAFSYFNRYATRKRRDLDIAGARQDIQKAYQLAPHDADIRAEYQQLHGWEGYNT
jgi:tetratricopeptide (TPR) repeat protein